MVYGFSSVLEAKESLSKPISRSQDFCVDSSAAVPLAVIPS